jgi:F-type H+-transporting ATPase subunit alpha
VSAYIPTNVISITDGQCFLETDLFNAGVRPAINVGISVSRVGGAAQPRAMRAVAGRLRVDLAQFRELEAFAAFGSDLDRASQQQLARGSRLVELLKQPAASPFPTGREIVSIWAGTNGKLDDIDVGDVRRFEGELLDYIAHNAEGLYEDLATTKQFTDDHANRLNELVDKFKKQFQPTQKSEESSEKKSDTKSAKKSNDKSDAKTEAKSEKKSDDKTKSEGSDGS